MCYFASDSISIRQFLEENYWVKNYVHFDSGCSCAYIGTKGMWEISALWSQFYCEVNTALKVNFIFLIVKENNKIRCTDKKYLLCSYYAPETGCGVGICSSFSVLFN